MINIIICEDDEKQKDFLEDKVRALNLNQDFSVHSFTDESNMLSYCKKLSGKFIFLMDIVLENQSNGIDVAKYINTHFSNSIIIFISAYLEKVTDIYETEHCYFIYKPEVDIRLEKALLKALSLLQKFQKTISVTSGTTQKMLFIDDIYYIERIKRYSLVKYRNEILRVSQDFSELLPCLHDHFHQCHRSYIVNFNKVQQYKRTDFLLKNNDLIPISRTYSKTINQLFQSYLINSFK